MGENQNILSVADEGANALISQEFLRLPRDAYYYITCLPAR